jgi:hypothetical protein
VLIGSLNALLIGPRDRIRLRPQLRVQETISSSEVLDKVPLKLKDESTAPDRNRGAIFATYGAVISAQ